MVSASCLLPQQQLSIGAAVADCGGPSLLLFLLESEGKRDGNLEGPGQLYQARFWFGTERKEERLWECYLYSHN